MTPRIGLIFPLLLVLLGCGNSDEGGPGGLGGTRRRLADETTSSRPEPGPELLIGKPIPAFQMTDINEQPITNASLKGKVVLIDFWATWCGPCRMVSPILQELHGKYGDQGLVVIGANTGEHDSIGLSIRTKDRAADYAREHNYTYTFTYGADDFQHSCHIDGFPAVLLIDRKGIVRRAREGFYAGFKADLESELRLLLREES